MTTKYVEVTIALDDANPDILEVFHRTKVDEGAWSEPSETTHNAPKSHLATTWVELEIAKV